MLRTVLMGATLALAPLGVAAQATLTAETSSPGGPAHYVSTTFAAALDSAGVATLQMTEGATLTNSVQAVAEGRVDVATAPLILPFLLQRGIGPYSGVGAEKGAELAAGIRALYFHAGAHQTFGYYDSKPVANIRKLDGLRIWNGPPRGAALTSGRAMIQLFAGLKDGEGYEGVQTPWPDAVSTVTGGAVDAWSFPSGLPGGREIQFSAAGAITIHDVPSDLLNSELGQQIVKAPGHAPFSVPVDVYRAAYEGNDITIVTDDDTFDSYSTAFAEIVQASMPEELVFDIVTAMLNAQERFEQGAPMGPYLNITFGDIDGVSQGACGAVQIKMHPGAIRAYEAQGHTIADCLRP
ncbi:TAXI family TRAP transporter solute-binding subunit [Tateyamaria armeniaca]|uniref:TAXI family TRAP transporter solute-binding subunit n=1 Tax=Tateyamaria armeniaca TaxID=2518930 RepID=A0ABW8UYN9_9RHOB